MKKTKIICTVGPSTDNVELLGRMMQAGMDLARFNFSHGSHEDHGKRLALVKEAAAKVGKVIATIADTKGPEMRLGMFANNKVTLHEGDEFVLTTDEVLGDEHIAHVNYGGLPQEVQVGSMILLADGLLSLEVTAIEDTKIHTKVVHGGEVQSPSMVRQEAVCTFICFSLRTVCPYSPTITAMLTFPKLLTTLWADFSSTSHLFALLLTLQPTHLSAQYPDLKRL